MAGYDKNLDQELSKQTVQVGDSKLTVSVRSYNGGTKKVQISRNVKNEQNQYGWSFAKLGRLTAEEIDVLLPVLNQARQML